MNSLIKTFLCLSLSALLIGEAQAIGFTISKRPACKLETITFKDTSTPPAGLSIISRTWFVQGLDSFVKTEDSLNHFYTSKIPAQTISLVITLSDGTRVQYSDPIPLKVVEPPTATVDANYNTTCPKETVKVKVTPAVGDTFIDSDSLQNGEIGAPAFSLFPSKSDTVFTYSNPAKYIINYKVVDKNNCSFKAYDTVTIISPPNVEFTPLKLSCRDSSVLYENRTKNGKLFKSWSWDVYDSVTSAFTTYPMPGDTLYFSYTWRKAGPQSIRLRGVDSFQCRDSTEYLTVNVDTSPKLVVDLSVDTIICFGESIKYYVTGADKLRWGNFIWGDTITSDSTRVVFTPKNTMTYTVYGITANCPPSGKDIKIRVLQPLATKITLTPDVILKGNKSIMAFFSNGIKDSMIWLPDTTVSCRKCDTTNASPPYSTFYHAKVFYSLEYCQCSAEDSAYLKVDTDCLIDSLRIPTAFTPNGDLVNDEFYLKAFSVKSITEMNIYNRWGNRVFHTENVAPNKPANGWNGRLNNNGDDLPPGLYIYNITAICVNEQKLNFQGEINLLR